MGMIIYEIEANRDDLAALVDSKNSAVPATLQAAVRKEAEARDIDLKKKKFSITKAISNLSLKKKKEKETSWTVQMYDKLTGALPQVSEWSENSGISKEDKRVVRVLCRLNTVKEVKHFFEKTMKYIKKNYKLVGTSAEKIEKNVTAKFVDQVKKAYDEKANTEELVKKIKSGIDDGTIERLGAGKLENIEFNYKLKY